MVHRLLTLRLYSDSTPLDTGVEPEDDQTRPVRMHESGFGGKFELE
jgi:hypothetical protein